MAEVKKALAEFLYSCWIPLFSAKIKACWSGSSGYRLC